MSKCIQEVVESCAALYSFSAAECMLALEVASSSSSKASKASKALRSSKLSSKSIPLPFLREHVNQDGCNGIIYNHGLFTQCKNGRETETMCNTCSTENCGTLEARMSADFKDPKGRRPSSYIAVLRKLKLTQEDAIQEAGKVNIELNELHFVEQEKVVKVKAVKVKVVKEVVVKVPKVKVVKEVVVKVPKVKVVKEVVVKEKVVKEKAVGRPKSTKRAIETVTVEDLFATLVSEEVDFCSDSESEFQFVDNEINIQQDRIVLIQETFEANQANQLKANVAVEKAEAELAKAVAKSVAKEQKKTDAKAESTERNQMHLADVEMKKLNTNEAKAAALVVAKQEKAAALAADKELKAAALVAAKQEKAAALLKEKESKALALVAAKQEKEAKSLATALAKQEKQEKSKPKSVSKTVVAVVAQHPVEEQPVKVSVKRMTISGVDYLISGANVLYFAETKEEAGIWNPVTESIDELPEESDDEEAEDDYESDEN